MLQTFGQISALSVFDESHKTAHTLIEQNNGTYFCVFLGIFPRYTLKPCLTDTTPIQSLLYSKYFIFMLLWLGVVVGCACEQYIWLARWVLIAGILTALAGKARIMTAVKPL